MKQTPTVQQMLNEAPAPIEPSHFMRRLLELLRYLNLSPAYNSRTSTTNVLTVQVLDATGAVLAAKPILGASEAHIGQVGGTMVTPSAQFTRPNDTIAYASGDLVANSTSAGSAVPMFWTLMRVSGGSATVRRVRIKKSGTSTTNASFRLHLYTAAPSVSNGDNAAWLSPHSGYVGSFDVTIDKVFSNASAGIGVPVVGSEVNIKLSGNVYLYGLLEARGPYTPAVQEVFTVELEAYLD